MRHGTEYRKMSTISIEGISNDGAMTIKAGDTMSDTIMVRLNPLGTLHDYSLLPIAVELPEESGIRPSRDVMKSITRFIINALLIRELGDEG